MSGDRIKVVGYAQRVFFNDGIEYRNFSDDLVGTQLASNGGASLFTIGNFSITTNLEDKISKLFYTSNFSDFINLSNLKFTNDDIIAILTETTKIKLNIDKSELTNYALFGSFTEYIRVSLENIILNWPASLSTSPINEFVISNSNPTVEDYVYDNINGISTFKVSTNVIKNKFGINFLKNGNIVNSFTNVNDLRNITVNYTDYVVSTNNGEFNILNFTGSTNTLNDYIYLSVEGDAFKDYLDFNVKYHIKPNALKVEKFFKSLNEFESYLLNRFSLPIYTSTFKYEFLSENGNLILSDKTITWPISDGYNIDFESDAYITFVTDLLEISENSDLTKTNLMNRFLVSESISDFDTLPTLNNDDYSSGQKINSLLNIYGREFDEIKKYIDGIAFANVVSYDKKNNIPDALVKNFARVLGWDITSSILEIDLINNYLSVNNSSYSGHSVSLSPIEAEVELWRRLILNSPWLWKSKGTRKSIEFLFKFIGTPNGLISFNEFIYVAENSMDMKLFNNILEEVTESTSIDGLNIDSEGFPLIQPDNENMYFQKGGLWYRETGGSNSKEDILYGNNPHIGPYDNGKEYIDQFRNLVPNFEPITIVDELKFTVDDNIFTNYDDGIFNGIFNNDVVVSFNFNEWFENLNTNIYSSLVEDLTSYQVHPFIDTCNGLIDIQMNSYLDDILIQSEILSGLTYSSNTISDSGTTYSGFTTFLNNTVFNLNTGNTTSLIGVLNDNTYNVIDDILACSDNASFYFNKQIDVRFDINFNYTCDGGDCDPDSLEVSSIDSETGLVIFSNVTDNIVPSADCCTNLGYNAVAAGNGFNCYTEVQTVSCDRYIPTKVDEDGFMIFIGPDGATYYVPSPQCCPIGSVAILNVDNSEYRCLVNVGICDDYIPSGTIKDFIMFSTPSGSTYTIPDSGCCPTNTTAIYNENLGGYNCQIDCYDYTGYTFVDNVVIFEYSGGTFTNMPSYKCCPSGSTPKRTLDITGQEVYICEQDALPPSTPIFSATGLAPDEDCGKTLITINGDYNDNIYYRIVINNNGNHGFTSTLVDNNNINYPAMSTGDNQPIIIPADGEVNLIWNLCARPTLRINQANCVDVSIIFTYEGVDVFTVNTYVCST